MHNNSVKIISTRIGYSNAILIANGINSVIVDTGVKGYFNHFKTIFKQHGLQPGDIKLIVLTHVHYDHTGNLKKLVKYTGAKVLVHKNEFANLKKGFVQIPKGQGKYSRLISKFGRAIVPGFASPKPFAADLINEDEFDLNEYGIDGKIISTPGNTLGSQSVLIGKQLISGDTFINMKNGKIFPPFANEPKILLETWQHLFNLGIEKIYPGHGNSLQVDEVLPEFEKWRNRLIKNIN